MTFPIATMADRKFLHWYRITQVPQMVVVDTVGRVLYSRGGELVSGQAVDSVLHVLDSLSMAAASSVTAAVR